MKRDSILSMISIAKKAGKVDAGEFKTEAAVKAGKASLVIISNEASANTTKKFSDMCNWHHTPFAIYGTKDELGAAIGCEFRASLAICDEGLANSIRKKITQAKEFEG